MVRLSYVGPGIFKKYCYTKDREFAELGSRFKASHVKGLLWWFAIVSVEAYAGLPDVPLFKLTVWKTNRPFAPLFKLMVGIFFGYNHY